MWYFAWLLGVGFATCCGIISVMWLESHYAFGDQDDSHAEERFERERDRELAKVKI